MEGADALSKDGEMDNEVAEVSKGPSYEEIQR